MTDEERQRTMDFIVNTLAQLSANDQKHERRFDRFVKLMLRAGRRERRIRSETDTRLSNALAVLAESQAHSDGRLDALIDIVRQQRNGSS